MSNLDTRPEWSDWTQTVMITGRRDAVTKCRRILLWMVSSAGEIPFMRRFSNDDKISYFGRMKRIREGLGLSESSMTRCLKILRDDGILVKKSGSYLIVRKQPKRKRK